MDHLKLNAIRPGFILFGLMTLVFGFLQYLFLPDTRFLKILGWDDHYYRLISTQFDPNFTGIILIITFLYLESMAIFKTNRTLQLIKQLVSITLITGLLLTYSRASFLAFLLALVLLFWRQFHTQKNYLQLIIYALYFIIWIPFLPRPAGEGVKLERTASIQSRLSNNSTALQSLQPYQWFIGRGLFTEQKINDTPSAMNHLLNIPDHAYLADNLLISLISYTGLTGTAIFIYLLYQWGKGCYQRDYYLFVTFISILFHSLFNNTLMQAFVLLMFLGGIVSSKQIKV